MHTHLRIHQARTNETESFICMNVFVNFSFAFSMLSADAVKEFLLLVARTKYMRLILATVVCL